MVGKRALACGLGIGPAAHVYARRSRLLRRRAVLCSRSGAESSGGASVTSPLL